MSDRQYDELIKKIIQHYDIIELEMIKNIAKRLRFEPETTPTTEWLIKKLSEIGGLNEDNLKVISKYSKLTKKEIKQILETVGEKTIPKSELTEAYKSGSITIEPNTFIESQVIQNIVNQSYKQLENTFLNINKAIVESARQQYVEILNQSYLEVSSGIYDYQTSIRRAINKFGDAGISGATYKYVDEDTGAILTRRYDIAGVVRRDVLTASHQLAVKSNMAVIEELQPKYVRLSEHVKCRPTHFHWQGTIIKREDLYEVTRIGEVDGLGGINCKHEVYAFYGKERGNDLKKIDKDESSEEYELSQTQRAMERSVRKWKRKETLFKGTDDEEMYNKSAKKRKLWQARLRNFTNENNLIRDYLREKV